MKMEKKTVALAILLMAIVAVGPVLADSLPVDVPTTAQVTGSHSPPVFKWKWELPDEDPFVTCTQVWPVPFGIKVVTCYMVVWDPNGPSDIQRVFIKVFYPNGTEKYQIEAVEILPETDIFDEIDQGVANGCIPLVNATDMKEELTAHEARAFMASFEMHHKQPPGCYDIIGYAVDTAGNTGTIENEFTYYSLKFLAIDFAGGINFGEIVPCVEQIVSGDQDMGTPQKPTVQNGGNDPFYISVHFTDMIGTNLNKKISDFDAVFLAQKIGCTACTTYTFANMLLVCHTEKMDFSVHAPLGTPVDTYTGTVTISIAP